MYILKTEVLDRKRFSEDQELTTSLRWMTRRHPHPLFLWIRSQSWGAAISPLLILVAVQLVYSLLLISFSYVLVTRWWLCGLWLAFLFIVACFNGARFYLEVLVERHANKADAEDKQKKPNLFIISSSMGRFVSFCLFLAFSLGGYYFLLCAIL